MEVENHFVFMSGHDYEGNTVIEETRVLAEVEALTIQEANTLVAALEAEAGSGGDEIWTQPISDFDLPTRLAKRRQAKSLQDRLKSMPLSEIERIPTFRLASAAHHHAEEIRRLRNEQKTSARWFLYCRNSAARHTADESDAACPVANPWRLFSVVEELSDSELSLLLRTLEAEFHGHLVDEGSISGALYEFVAENEVDLSREPTQLLRRTAQWAALEKAYSPAPAFADEHFDEFLLHTQARDFAEQIQVARDETNSKPIDAAARAVSPPGSDLSNLQLTPGLATIVTAGACLNCLAEIRRCYPTALPDEEASRLHQQLIESTELWLQLVESGRFKPVYERPSFAGVTNESIPALMASIALSVVGDVPQSELLSATDRVFHSLQELAAEPVKSIAYRLSEVEIFSCRTPDPKVSPEFADLRRALHLLSEYWGVVRHLVSIEAHSYVYRIPHPLLPTIVNLRERIDACFRQLQGDSGADEAKSTIESFLDVLASSDVDDLQAVPEYTNRRLAEVELFLEQTRLALGRKTFPLTRAEESFLRMARLGVGRYEQDVSEGKKRANAYLEKVGEERKEEAKAKTDKPSVPAAAVLTHRHDASQPSPGVTSAVIDATPRFDPIDSGPQFLESEGVLFDAWMAGQTLVFVLYFAQTAVEDPASSDAKHFSTQCVQLKHWLNSVEQSLSTIGSRLAAVSDKIYRWRHTQPAALEDCYPSALHLLFGIGSFWLHNIERLAWGAGQAKPAPESSEYFETLKASYRRVRSGLQPLQINSPSLQELEQLRIGLFQELSRAARSKEAVSDERTADSKADNGPKFSALLPESGPVRDLCYKLKKELPQGKSRIVIAREITGESEGNAPKAQSLLRQARRFRHLWDPKGR